LSKRSEAVYINRNSGLCIKDLCLLLCVSSSSYYFWLKQKFARRGVKTTREQEDLVKVVFEFSDQTYGARRVYEELKRRGRTDFSIWLVRVIMRKLMLKSVYCIISVLLKLE